MPIPATQKSPPLHPIDECKQDWFDASGKRQPTFRKGRPLNRCLDDMFLISTDGLPQHQAVNCQCPLPVNCNALLMATPNKVLLTPQDTATIPPLPRFMGQTFPTDRIQAAETGETTGTLTRFQDYSELDDPVKVPGSSEGGDSGHVSDSSASYDTDDASDPSTNDDSDNPSESSEDDAPNCMVHAPGASTIGRYQSISTV